MCELLRAVGHQGGDAHDKSTILVVDILPRRSLRRMLGVVDTGFQGRTWRSIVTVGMPSTEPLSLSC